jgi:hypothetical protein
MRGLRSAGGGRRLIEIVFPRNRSVRGEPAEPPRGPTSAVYHWALRRLGMRATITAQLRRWQYTEPLVWLLAVGTAGVILGRAGDAGNLLWCGAGILIGTLSGHLFWGNK